MEISRRAEIKEAGMAKRPAKGAGQRLTDKQDAFALAYVETGNAAEAYRRAYDVAESARDGWLYVEACQLLDNPKVALRIKELQAQAQRLSIYIEPGDDLASKRLFGRLQAPALLNLLGLDLGVLVR